MFHEVREVTPLPDYGLLLVFANGEKRNTM